MADKWLERSEKMARKFKVVIDGKEYTVEVEEIGQSQEIKSIETSNSKPLISESAQIPERPTNTITSPSKPSVSETRTPTQGEKHREVKSPMAGLILKVLVGEGESVSKGQKLVILEAMKMENDIIAESPGVVSKVFVKEGENVETGQTLILIK